MIWNEEKIKLYNIYAYYKSNNASHLIFDKKIEGKNSFVYLLNKHLFFQRDLDFVIEIDFNGELSQLKESNSYKMR